MQGRVLHAFALTLALLLAISHAVAAAPPVIVSADDQGRVFARFVPAPDPVSPLILLFHQAESNKDEYAPIQPRLAEAGYASLAIDQRSGGDYFGPNETVAARGGASSSFDEAYADLEAALAWARAQAPPRPIIVWGSSYSASLVFQLAADHPSGIAAVLAFSPGEYLQSSVAAAAAKVHVPVFVTSAPDQGEETAAAAILAEVPAGTKQQFRQPAGGMHGSATLRDDLNLEGAPVIWSAVLAFLQETVPPR